MATLKQQFDAATAKVRNTPSSEQQVGQETQLKIYSLFKQANNGDAPSKKPSLLNPVARAKHKAWLSIKGMTQEDAMRAYLEAVDAILGIAN